MSDFLDKIAAAKRRELVDRKASCSLTELRSKAMLAPLPPRLLPNGGIIAEIKRRSPSKGNIRPSLDAAELAQDYSRNGADAISVLTETGFFAGSDDDLLRVRQALPEVGILRKDFTLDMYQIWEARYMGASAVLLIVALLQADQLREMLEVTREAGLEAVVEVHTFPECELALAAGAQLVGVNNRDLHSFRVDTRTCQEMILAYGADGSRRWLAESGISTPDQIGHLRSLGFDGFLVGESLLRHERPGDALAALLAGTSWQ